VRKRPFDPPSTSGTIEQRRVAMESKLEEELIRHEKNLKRFLESLGGSGFGALLQQLTA
jgi:hypothetical protein